MVMPLHHLREQMTCKQTAQVGALMAIGFVFVAAILTWVFSPFIFGTWSKAILWWCKSLTFSWKRQLFLRRRRHMIRVNSHKTCARPWKQPTWFDLVLRYAAVHRPWRFVYILYPLCTLSPLSGLPVLRSLNFKANEWKVSVQDIGDIFTLTVNWDNSELPFKICSFTSFM